MSDDQTNQTNRFTLCVTNNRDTGSLGVGLVAGTKEWRPGEKIQIEGEANTRTVTWVMGKGEKIHLCAKGTGAFPLGEVRFRIVSAETATEMSEADLDAATTPNQAN